MTQADMLLIALAACSFLLLCVAFLSFALRATCTYLKHTQEDFAQREAAWRDEGPRRSDQSDIRLVTGLFDERRVREIMRERNET